MSLINKARLSSILCRFSLRSVTPVRQSNLYSTKITHTIEVTDTRTQKSSESSSKFSDRIKEQTGEKVVRPKPSEIPYQGKVANFVNLIGVVKTPVHFEADSAGNYFAATVISQETSGEKEPLLIPVVFEGDLAHVVSHHVKGNDRVHVSGRLSTDPMRFALGDSLVNFHLVVKNLNFVEGFTRNFSYKKVRVPFSRVGITKRGSEKIEDEMKIEDKDDDDDFTQQWGEALEEAKVKRWAENSKLVESKLEECNEEDGKSCMKKKNLDRN